MLAVTHSGVLVGVEAQAVQVEVNVGEVGEPRTLMVGLPDSAVRESIERVRSALSHCKANIPLTRTVINLAPGHLRKEGALYDLPIAIGLLVAHQRCEALCLEDYLIAGELSLSGQLRPIRGALALATLAKQLGKKGVVLPVSNAEEAALVPELASYGARDLPEALCCLQNPKAYPLVKAPTLKLNKGADVLDFADVKGQHVARRATEIAAAGGHNLLLAGPPGSGKSMIAARLPSIMPPPNFQESLEILMTHSAAGLYVDKPASFASRPFRSPHHSISQAGLVGGGSRPRPGELSLAHQGVLFLDELLEFDRRSLESLRQPLEEGQLTISRALGTVSFPARILLVGAMNLCPCGRLGDSKRACPCTPSQVHRYRQRLSGPLLDRLDIQVELSGTEARALRDQAGEEDSATIAKRVRRARARQLPRFGKKSKWQASCNSALSPQQLKAFCQLDLATEKVLLKAMEHFGFSARAHDKILKIARTIADLAASDPIALPHLMEALQYRRFETH